MYPSERNRQPTLRGVSFRVGDRGNTDLSEMDYLREAIISACVRAGSLYAHWRRFTPDWNPGPCPRCFNETFPGSINDECPICYKTAYEGGYSKPIVQWMIVQDQDETIEKTHLGFVRIARGESLSPYVPRIATSDLVGRVIETPDGFDVRERFAVTDTVKPTRLRENLEIFGKGNEDHLEPEPDVAAYKFYCSYLQEHADDRMKIIEYSVPFEDPVWLGLPTELRTRI